jgi:ABC-type glycerol-3-phosphate transport system permease component
MGKGKTVKKYMCTVIAVLFTLVYLFPLYWMVITSFKTKEEIFSAKPTFWPKSFYQKADTIVMENFFAPLSLSQFLERLKDKHHGNTDFYVFIFKK